MSSGRSAALRRLAQTRASWGACWLRSPSH